MVAGHGGEVPQYAALGCDGLWEARALDEDEHKEPNRRFQRKHHSQGSDALLDRRHGLLSRQSQTRLAT